MAEDWKVAAAADLREKMEGENRLMDTLDEQIRMLEASKHEAAKRMAAYIDAAITLGIELATPKTVEGAPPFQLEQPKAQLTARDIILDALRAAHPFPMKSAELRQTIENAMGRPIHYKTPGMTLYRLAESGLVRRQGHNWFYVGGEEEVSNDDLIG